MPGATVGEVIEALEARAGDAGSLLTAGPAIREHLNIFVDGERAGLGTAVGDAVVHVIPAVSGG